MKLSQTLAATAVLALLGISLSAEAYDADWKRGRIYYRSVCTACHVASPIGSVNPSTKTKAEWAAYMKADKHAKGKETVKQYVSKTYRAMYGKSPRSERQRGPVIEPAASSAAEPATCAPISANLRPIFVDIERVSLDSLRA